MSLLLLFAGAITGQVAPSFTSAPENTFTVPMDDPLFTVPKDTPLMLVPENDPESLS